MRTTLDFELPPGSGVLLVAHGSRQRGGVEEFRTVARLVSQRARGLPLESCFLEFAEPAIRHGFDRLVERGVCHVVVAPVVLFAAAHLRQDIPRQVAEAAARHPRVRVSIAPHLGCHPALIDLSGRRFFAAIVDQSIPADQVALVMVGRGSSDREATAEMLRFTEMRQRSMPVRAARCAFLAMARPPLEETLHEVAAMRVRCVVVQPHLLFRGVLLDRLAAEVRRFAARYPHVQWCVAGHLGPDEAVCRALFDRMGEATSDWQPAANA